MGLKGPEYPLLFYRTTYLRVCKYMYLGLADDLQQIIGPDAVFPPKRGVS